MAVILTVPEIRNLLAPIFRAHGVKRAVLFGSYGKGIATNNSDVDLLVDSNLRGLRFVGLINDIQVTIGKPVDVLDVAHIVKNSRIEQEIQETGILLYEQ